MGNYSAFWNYLFRTLLTFWLSFKTSVQMVCPVNTFKRKRSPRERRPIKLTTESALMWWSHRGIMDAGEWSRTSKLLPFFNIEVNVQKVGYASGYLLTCFHRADTLGSACTNSMNNTMIGTSFYILAGMPWHRFRTGCSTIYNNTATFKDIKCLCNKSSSRKIIARKCDKESYVVQK